MRIQVFLHNLKNSVRILARSKIFTAINLSGLVLGLTAAFILIIFAINELSYNSGYKNADRIYRLILNDSKGNKLPLVPLTTKSALSNRFSGIEQSFRMINLEHFIGLVEMQKNNISIPLAGFFCADPEMITSLQLKMMSGRRTNFLRHHSCVVLSSDAAARIFPSSSPIGKQIDISINGIAYQLIVEGVYEPLPWNSTIKADFITGIALYDDLLRKSSQLGEADLSYKDELTVETYFLLKPGESVHSMIPRLPSFSKYYYPKENVTFEVQNLRDIYLNSGEIQNDFVVKGNKENIYIYLSLAFFILLLATINYSMLGTARSALRFKEIGVRKVLGATKSNLRSQLLAESLMLTLFAFPLAFLLLGLVGPVIEYYYSYRIFFFSSNLALYLGISALITILIGLLSGTYIAIYLSSLDPLTALKSNYYIYKKVSFSKIFIVFQFLITIGLVISLLTISKQLNFFLKQNNLRNKEILILIPVNQLNINSYFKIKSTILASQLSSSISCISIPFPTNDMALVNIKFPGDEQRSITFESISVDVDFFKTLGIIIKSGSDFSEIDNLTRVKSVIINEEAVRQINFEDPLAGELGSYKIIGVVKDFHMHTLHKKIEPTIFLYNPEGCQSIIIRCKEGKEEELHRLIKDYWQTNMPGTPLEYKHFDQELNTLYLKERNFGRVIGSFTFLAFVITGMGLFGLAMLIVERRMKEMSIRKVFGASPGSIIYLIQQEFILFIIIASAIAIPLAWYFLSLWLNEFYYRVPMQWYLFALAVIVVGGFVSLILLLKTLRILRENPANALKYE